MFQDRDEDVVFMETAMHLRSHPHMAIEVIPMPQEVGHMAPIYFKVSHHSNSMLTVLAIHNLCLLI